MQKNAIFSKTNQFRAMVSIDDLKEIVHGLFKEANIGSLKSKMPEIRHLDNRHDVIFFCWGCPIWIKFGRLVQNDMLIAVIWLKSKSEVEFRYGWCLFFQTENTYISAVHWIITTKFGLLIDLLKRTNPKPEVKLRRSIRRLENRYNIWPDLDEMSDAEWLAQYSDGRNRK